MHEDSVERRHVCPALAQFWAERNVEQIVDVPVPQIETADQSGDHACRVSADSQRRQGCRPACGDATTGPSGSDCAGEGGGPAGAVRRQNGGSGCDHAGAPGDMGHIVEVPMPHIAKKITEVVETIPQERTWCIFEEFDDLPRQSADGPRPNFRGRPYAGYDAASLPPPDGVAGALAWLSSRPARSEQPLVQHTSHGYRLRWAHDASSRW